MDIDYLKIVITVVLAVLGWIAGHYFTTRRDVAFKRLDISIEHLVEAYRILANEISYRDLTEQRLRQLEDLISDIQLFGSPEQVKLARRLAEDVASGGRFELDPLINSLRHSLREQLNLDPVPGNVQWFRHKNDRVNA